MVVVVVVVGVYWICKSTTIREMWEGRVRIITAWPNRAIATTSIVRAAMPIVEHQNGRVNTDWPVVG
jgi:hypothetical protein